MLTGLKTLMTGVALATTLMAAPALTQTAIKADLTIDTAKSGKVIPPEIYGHFAEHLGRMVYEGVWVGEDSKIPNTRGIRNDVVGALKHLNVPVIRWPGGCFADRYHWMDGIGPRDKRPVTINTIWGGVEESNAFGTHEFMDFAEQIGSKVYIAGNVGTGSPKEMSQWLEYMTASDNSQMAKLRRQNGREAPWKVEYFGVGNETWGCGGDMTPEHSANLFKQFATFSDNYHPDQKTPETRMVKVMSGANVADFNWTEVSMKMKNNNTHALSLHYYTSAGLNWPPSRPSTGFDEAGWAVVLKEAFYMEELVQKHSAIMDKYDPEKKVALYVDEWGTWYKTDDLKNPGFLYQQNSLRDGLVAALHFNIFHKYTDRVKMANLAQTVNVLQAVILTDKDKMILTPTYHVFDLYKPFMGATHIPVMLNSAKYTVGDISLPAVDVSAAKGKDGKIWLAVVNLDPNRPAEVNTSTMGFKAKSAVGRVLTGDRIDAHNTFDKPNTVTLKSYEAKASGSGLVLKLAPKSVTVVEFR
ncbi:alpha-N-arabinofuranosidase [Asticcacaulis endophyticus]|uniref:non-reducing end alpha-L-arabinofuranosidase n=1 Tax=Asticcacaulis endophyticus TaxID=1395890 RepID=A0A918Q9S8_9CAUL|nr:alpha-L-arabinofuranosidase C-terminal domain-containing protein [Asticcacaulis endophyticus]GGZ38471.1 alpha-L-arabinofuranosidase [Asticcacaulis endophyticus]